MSNRPVEVVELLQQIAERLAALPADIARELAVCSAKVPPSRADRAALAALLPLVQTILHDANFTARELLNHVVGDVELDERLQLALHAAVGKDDAGRSRRLGRLLARGEGVVIGGLAVQRVGPSREATLWKVEWVSKHA